MKRLILIISIVLSSLSGISQELYTPQHLYDAPQGLMDLDSLRTIKIDFYEANYHDTLVNNWISDNGRRLPAAVHLSNGTTLDSVGVRYKGNSTFDIPNGSNNPKLPFNIDINDYLAGQTLLDYKKLKLANAMFDPTFSKEITAYDVYRRYLPAPQANFMKVEVQGNYLGLYVNTESIDKKFLKKHFNEKSGVLFKCDPVQQFGQGGPTGNSDLAWLGSDTSLYYDHYKLKSEVGWGELVHLIDVLNNNPAELDSVLNIDRVLWAFAVNNVVSNHDAYNGLYQHNYYLYQSKDGLFQMIPWDVSESFVGALYNTPPDPSYLYEHDPFNGYNSTWTPLVQALTSDPTSRYGKIYSAHIRTIMNESLNVNEIGYFVDEMQILGYDAADDDPNKYFDMSAYSSNVDNEYIIPFVFACGGITSTVNLRKPYLESHLEIAKIPPSISGTEVISVDEQYFVTTIIDNGLSAELMTTTSVHNSKFISQIMVDDGTNGDQLSNDGIFTALLPYSIGGPQVKFYVRAENSGAIQLDPQRAEYEFYLYDNTLSIKRKNEGNNLNVFPSPTNSSLILEGVTSASCKIYNIYGALILAESIKQSNPILDVSNLPNGFYFVEVNGIIKKFQKIQ